FRYRMHGQVRVNENAPIVGDLLTSDGTLRTIILSKLSFEALGPSLIAVFFLGSLSGLVGTWLIFAAVHDVSPRVPIMYSYGICLFPSVLYWSSSFGKESFSVLAMGLVTWGAAGLWSDLRTYHRAVRWAGVFVGVSLAGVVRPQIAVMLVIAAVC